MEYKEITQVSFLFPCSGFVCFFNMLNLFVPILPQGSSGQLKSLKAAELCKYNVSVAVIKIEIIV